MPRVRKTKRYYIDEINKSMSFAFNSLEEIIKKYGDKVYREGRRTYSEIILYTKIDSFWSYKINSFRYSPTLKKIFVEIYWQGDSTDGDYFKEFTGQSIRIPKAKPVDLGSRYYVAHNEINISTSDLYEAIKTTLN